MKIAENIFYVGVNDRNKERFECLWPLTNGMSYNSFLVVGKKIALIDTVDSRFFPLFMDKIKSVIGERPIDYLIINHMEPDHSGSIGLIRQYYPDVILVGNKKTLQMAKGFYSVTANELCVAEKSTLDLGDLSFTFYLTPMVHWPETMVTYETTRKVLFSGDAFGCFGALNGGVLDTQINIGPYFPEMLRYYSNIVGKYGCQVQMALKKLAGLELRMICSTHGPVWTESIPQVLAEYNRLSLYKGEDGVCLVFGSMYGHTMEMAESVAEGLVRGGLKNFVMRKLSRTDPSYLIADAFRYKGLLLGAPTYNNGLYPLMEHFVTDLQHRQMKNRLIGCFGSFSWAGQAVKKLVDFATSPGMEMVGVPVEMKQGFNHETGEKCRLLGMSMASRILDKK